MTAIAKVAKTALKVITLLLILVMIISSVIVWKLADSKPNLIEQSLQDMRLWLAQQGKREKKAQNLPAFLWGISMGGSYANYTLANNQAPWQGLVIVSSFAHMRDLVDVQVDKFVSVLPVAVQSLIKPMLVKMFTVFLDWQGGAEPKTVNPATVAATINLPVLKFHGDKDQLIDISQGRQLFASYQSPDKTWITVTGVGHNDVLITKEPMYATMANWLLRHAKVTESESGISD